jgi:hypothetical protein
MSWKTFAEESPELAALGLEQLNRTICYLALLDEAGAPRIHPITPFIGGGMLFMFTEPTSPKIRDLQRDGRYAIHSAVTGDGPLIEFLVTGEAELITDPTLRVQAAQIASSPVVSNTYSLFEFHVGRVLAVTYDEEKQKIVHRWRSR